MTPTSEATGEVAFVVTLKVKAWAESVTDEQLAAYLAEPEAQRAIEQAVAHAVERACEESAGWIDDNHEAFVVEINDASACLERTDPIAGRCIDCWRDLSWQGHAKWCPA